MAERPKLAIVDIVKAVSCIMIFLYHCNTILPGEWKFLTLFGQDLGNNLFFMVSGFTLAPSIDATPVNRLHIWYSKRLIRILPITVIAYALTWLRGYFSFLDPSQLFAVFIYPTLYWFITSILVFYVILFFIGKYTGKGMRTAICTALAAAYIVLGDRHERLYVIGLFAMIAGYVLREMMISGHPQTRDSAALRKVSAVLTVICFILFMCGELTDVPYISNGLILSGAAGTGLSALLLGSLLDEGLELFFERHRGLHSFIVYLGNMALPLYLVQCFCSGYIGFYIGLHVVFPLSFLVNFIVVWTAGTVLYFIESFILRFTTGFRRT